MLSLLAVVVSNALLWVGISAHVCANQSFVHQAGPNFALATPFAEREYTAIQAALIIARMFVMVHLHENIAFYMNCLQLRLNRTSP